MTETVDPILLEKYRAMAATGVQFRGFSILNHKREILALKRETSSTTLLDYGCGAGEAWLGNLPQYLGFPAVTLYDPAFRLLDRKPDAGSKFDMVVCCDVLEHIPEQYVDAVIDELFAYASKAVFATVCCRSAKKRFPDGTNLHCTLKPFEWWEERFHDVAMCKWVLVETA